MHIKETESLELAQMLGARLRQARLNQNITQEQMAEKIGVSRHTVISAEKGEATLLTFISMLKVLRLTHQLDAFLPEQPISPIQLAKLQGQQRQRASGVQETLASGVLDEDW